MRLIMAGISLAILGSPLVFAGEGMAPVNAPVARVDNEAAPDAYASGLKAKIVARGAMKLENGSSLFALFGYANDGPLTPAAGTEPVKGTLVEATKTEPDKNTYLVLAGQKGADAAYDYGTHFLFQGHESGPNGQGSLTRINLDADEAHRITLMAEADVAGKPLPLVRRYDIINEGCLIAPRIQAAIIGGTLGTL